MRIRRRRRVDIVVLAGVVVLAGLAAVAGVVAAEPERVARLWAGAELGRGGAAQITEVIDYDFASRQRHGIYRDIPGLAAGDPVQVASPTAPAQLQVAGTSQQVRLRIGDPRRFLSGSEPHHAEEAARRGHLREYTAWAVAVGELDRWSRAVAGSSTARADPAAARYPLLAPALVSGTSGSSARPSSSGSGAGGGVGGGGGGGSW
jgi:hypothetical protein